MKPATITLASLICVISTLTCTALAPDGSHDVATASPELMCTAYFYSEDETRQLFFAQELVDFFDAHEPSTEQKAYFEALQRTLDEELGSSAQEFVESNVHEYSDGLLGGSISFYMPPEQKKQLLELHTHYRPVTVTILNTSETSIKIPHCSYIKQLTPHRVNTLDVLSVYPLLQPLGASAWWQTRAYGLVGGIAALGGIYGYSQGGMKRIVGLPFLGLGILGLATAYRRYYKTENPLNALLRRYKCLGQLTVAPSITEMRTNHSEYITGTETITLESNTFFSETFFVRADCPHVIELTLEHS